MDDWKSEFLNNRPIACSKCKGKLYYQGGGIYKCEDCGNTELDDFGKVREYLEENGIQSAYTIHDATGVSLSLINNFVRDGRLEIPDGSGVYIKCLNCGCAIRYGKYCPQCTSKIVKNLNGMFAVMGEKPQKEESNGKNSMRYLGRENK